MKQPTHPQQSDLVTEFLHSSFCTWYPIAADGSLKKVLHLYKKKTPSKKDAFRQYEYTGQFYFLTEQDALAYLQAQPEACRGFLSCPDHSITKLLATR